MSPVPIDACLCGRTHYHTRNDCPDFLRDRIAKLEAQRDDLQGRNTELVVQRRDAERDATANAVLLRRAEAQAERVRAAILRVNESNPCRQPCFCSLCTAIETLSRAAITTP